MLEPRRVLRWVWLGRVVFSCAILVAAVFVWSEAAPSDTLIATLAFACATLATIGSVLYSEFERRALGMGFYAIQCAIDLALVTAVVHITGGWSSQFAALYILVIACAALLLPFRGGLAVAANTFSRVQGVGINFDGELNAVKGDSTYLFDRTLRLQGILQSRPSGGGLDLHPLNTGANSTLRTRLAFIASSEPVIDVFDTYCYRKIATIPIRDPIIGPVRATTRPNGQLVLVGATIRGVTVVALPDNFTTSCQ